MSNGTILFITLGLIVFVGLLIQYFLWKSKVKDRKSIADNWDKFLIASSKNDINDIKYFGDKLVWNKYLKQEQLTKITQVVASKAEEYPELEQLKLDLFNKQLDYNRTLPEIGSSGGIPQSW